MATPAPSPGAVLLKRPGSGLGAAAALSVFAAFGWATYYLFILRAGPETAPSAALVYPFLFGGVAYVLWSWRAGGAQPLAALFRSPDAWGRTALLLVMQLGVLAATYLTGPVDSALLALLGDVVATPLLVAVWLSEEPRRFVTAGFVAGLALSIAGGSLAIAGGRSLESIPALGWLVVPALPLAVAFYFVLSARAGAGAPGGAVVAQSMLGAGLVSLLLAPALPGGWTGLVAIGPGPFVLLAANGLVSFFLAPLCYFRAIEKAGFVLPPMLMTGIPVFTLLLSVAFLALVPTPIALLGIPVAVVGGVVVLWSERDAPSVPVTASR